MPLFYNERVFDNATKHYNEPSFTAGSITRVSSTHKNSWSMPIIGTLPEHKIILLECFYSNCIDF